MPRGPQPYPSSRSPFALALCIGLAALLATLPLILHGCSCGHDQVFHLQGWLDAAQQLRHGHYPRWSFTSAWNAGEPRFLFYPPLSWLLGAALTLLFPAALAPTIYIFLAPLLSGLTFHHLATHITLPNTPSLSPNPTSISPNAALLASALYLANPYMLFNAFERSAYAELLAAAWIPLLLLAVLRPRPTARGIALPVSLLWLTNAPAAVMGCYALALLATLRLILALTSPKNSERTPPPLRLALTYIAGTFLGLALPAFYLLPAAYERRFVQVTMAIIPGMRPQDNFLFAYTPDPGHNGVNHQITLLALTLIALTFAALTTLLLRTYFSKTTALSTNAHSPRPGAPFMARPHRDMGGMTTQPPPQQTSTLSTEPPNQQPRVLSTEARSAQRRDLQLPATLTLLAATITFLLFPPSTFLWLHVPELAFLQLPWRLLTLLTPLLALTLALLLSPIFCTSSPLPSPSAQDSAQGPALAPRTLQLSPSAQDPGAPRLASETWVRRISTLATLAATLLLPLALGYTAFHLYAQYCFPDETPRAIAQNLLTHHGFPPTDEYTPTHADNDLLRTNNPAYWLLPNLPSGQPADPNTPAPHTTPTATELNPSLDTDDTPIPPSQTLSTPAPHHLTLNLQQPATLVLNLRDYPNWRITETTATNQLSPSAQDRDDGLLAIPIPAGPSTLDITWHRTPDQTLGLAISALALLTYALTHRRIP